MGFLYLTDDVQVPSTSVQQHERLQSFRAFVLDRQLMLDISKMHFIVI